MFPPTMQSISVLFSCLLDHSENYLDRVAAAAAINNSNYCHCPIIVVAFAYNFHTLNVSIIMGHVLLLLLLLLLLRMIIRRGKTTTKGWDCLDEGNGEEVNKNTGENVEDLRRPTVTWPQK